jgi:hypothetical protein
MGWAGRPAASDMREPDCERPCCPPVMCTELVRFIADEGIGIADILLFTGPSVYNVLEVLQRRRERRKE